MSWIKNHMGIDRSVMVGAITIIVLALILRQCAADSKETYALLSLQCAQECGGEYTVRWHSDQTSCGCGHPEGVPLSEEEPYHVCAARCPAGFEVRKNGYDVVCDCSD